MSLNAKQFATYIQQLQTFDIVILLLNISGSKIILWKKMLYVPRCLSSIIYNS